VKGHHATKTLTDSHPRNCFFKFVIRLHWENYGGGHRTAQGGYQGDDKKQRPTNILFLKHPESSRYLRYSDIIGNSTVYCYRKSFLKHPGTRMLIGRMVNTCQYLYQYRHPYNFALFLPSIPLHGRHLFNKIPLTRSSRTNILIQLLYRICLMFFIYIV
jgi:hypothetical protein